VRSRVWTPERGARRGGGLVVAGGGVKWEAVEPRGPWRGAVCRGFGWIGRGPGGPSLDNGRDGMCRLRAFPSRSESRLISIGVFFG
jgi:hypothetical protein